MAKIPVQPLPGPPSHHSWDTPASGVRPCQGRLAPRGATLGDSRGEVWAGGQPPCLPRLGLRIHPSPIPGEDQERAQLWPGVSRAGAALPLPPPPCPQPCLALLWQLLGKLGLGRGSARSNQTQPRADRSEIQVRDAETGPVAHIHLSWPFLSPGTQGHCFCPALASESMRFGSRSSSAFPLKLTVPKPLLGPGLKLSAALQCPGQECCLLLLLFSFSSCCWPGHGLAPEPASHPAVGVQAGPRKLREEG